MISGATSCNLQLQEVLVAGPVDPGFPASTGCFGLRKRFQTQAMPRGHARPAWAPNLDTDLIGKPLSHWLLDPSSTTLDASTHMHGLMPLLEASVV